MILNCKSSNFYIENALNIKEDIAALNSGVTVLDELLRRRDVEQRTAEKERIANMHRQEAEQRALEKEQEVKRRRQEAEQRALEKEREDEKSDRMQIAFTVLTVLSVLSLPKTLAEFFSIDIVDWSNWENPWICVLLIVFYIIALFVLTFVLKYTLPVLKKLKESKKE